MFSDEHLSTIADKETWTSKASSVYGLLYSERLVDCLTLALLYQSG